MKIAIIIAYILIAVLAIVTIMNWMAIQKLIRPAAPADATPKKEAAPAGQGDGSASFGDMINAVRNGVNGAKEVEIKASF